MEEIRRLGASGLKVSSLGVGVWSWGDTAFWGYGTSYSQGDVEAAYRASLEAGITFYDTAEIYGNGNSEQLLGQFAHTYEQPIVIASKFAPLPFRFSADALLPALDASLKRLKIEQLDLYQIHWPYSIIQIESLMDKLAEAVKAGKIKAVGVSNYSAKHMHEAQTRLARYGIKLASNQVQYNLLKRSPEVNGVLKACRELDVALIAYSPLAQGALTGKFASDPTAIKGPRRLTRNFRPGGRREIEPALQTLQKIAATREKTVEQVALNWLLCKDELVIPIPGAKTARQAKANAGALGWRLSEEEVRQLDKVTALRLT